MNGCPVVCDLQAFCLKCSATYRVRYIIHIKKTVNHTLLLHDLQAFFVFLQHSLWDKNFHFIDASKSN